MSFRALFITLLSTVIYASPVVAGSDAEADKDAIAAFMKSDVVRDFHESAYGYAVFPDIGKGGFGVGGAYGKGGVYRDGKKTGNASMAQVSIGFQLGGQVYRQVIYFQDKRAFDDFTSGNFEFSAQAEAIAVTASAGVSAGSEGTSASANSEQSEARYHKGMVVFTMGKGGLMYQATLGGQKYNYTPLE